MSRVADLVRFYTLLDWLKQRVGGTRMLSELGNFRDWPNAGLYLFFEPSEKRSDSGDGFRIVRVGTHALREGSRSTLRQRLGQHRGRASGVGGNHRGSIFRLLIGQALLARGDLSHCGSWGVKGEAAKAAAKLSISREALASSEAPVEQAVTQYIANMQFLWLKIDDKPGPNSLRGVIERNAIALLSNHERTTLDLPSHRWLGHASDRPLVRSSGLWNQRHVSEAYDPAFLDIFETIIKQTGRDG